MKRAFLLLMSLCFGLCITLAQTTFTKHEVKKGETLESVAKQYGVTTQMIKDANPQMGSYFYVGMKLNIPEKKHSEEDYVKKETLPMATSIVSKTNETANMENEFVSKSRKGSFITGVYAGLSMNTYTGSDAAKETKNKMGFHAGLFGDYFIGENIFAEIGIGVATKGYKLNVISTSGQVWDDDGPNYDYEHNYKMNTYNIDLPISIGYDYRLSTSSSVFLRIGTYLTYALSGKKEMEGYEEDWDTPSSSSSGSVSSSTKIKDMDGFNKFGVGLQCGGGLRYECYTLSFSYQRGLTKIIDKAKEYEQNLLVTLGYYF